jgi:hypothetical protein
MLKNMQYLLLAGLATCTLAAGLPASASDAMNQPFTYTPAPTLSRFEERITHLKEQTALAESKGWITGDQATQFKANFEKVSGLYDAAKQHPKAVVDENDLEKQVTGLHHDLHSAIATGSAPKTPVAVDSKDASSESKNSSTSHTRRWRRHHRKTAT